ncbi:sensor histidine kinase [Microbacterium sp.]|uniref:sensor histidine kinase n=1 Tax=Microbacterium sp. TaxID=51671 RepID=UPI0039E53AAF
MTRTFPAQRQRMRTLGVLLIVVGSGFVLTALGIVGVHLVAGRPLPWAAVSVYGAGAVLTLGALAVVGWVLLERAPAPVALTETPAPEERATRTEIARTDDPAPRSGPTATVRARPYDSEETAFEVQRRLLDDVRHELKTPITIIRGHLEVMDPQDTDDVATIRDLGIAELDRMTRLIGDIDLLAAVEGDQFVMGSVDLGALTERIAELVTVIPGHDWSIETAATAVIRGDGDRLLQAWLQLADNAAKHTPPGSPIELGSAVHPGGARLWVRDHGPGIPPALRHRVFRRFDRGAGKRTVGGSGLGLAIVDTIAKAHGGYCALADTPGGGVTFTLEIPTGTAALPSPIRAGDVLLQWETTA